MKLTLELSDAQVGALMTACETLARCGMGQFKSLAEAVVSWESGHRYQKIDGFEELAKLLLMPDMHRKGYYAMHNKNVPKVCQQSWELYATVRHAVAWARLAAEGRTEPEFHGCQYDQPMGVSGDPMPVVSVSLE
jgi:hypothetical protein